jgi:hypothetical protein
VCLLLAASGKVNGTAVAVAQSGPFTAGVAKASSVVKGRHYSRHQKRELAGRLPPRIDCNNNISGLMHGDMDYYGFRRRKKKVDPQ